MSAELDALLGAIRGCRICIEAPRGAPLPHEPRPVLQADARARILIAGQAPGTRVHASGRPFTDPSGDRLRGWMGVDEAVFYDSSRIAIVPMGFCFPGLDAKGGDKPPRKECAPAWRGQVMAALPGIELVIVIGAYAQDWHLGDAREKTLTATVARWRDYLDLDPPVIVLPHPSWRNTGFLKRHPWVEAEIVPELQRRVAGLI